MTTPLATSGLDLFRLNNVLRLLVQDPLGFLKYGDAVHEILIDRDGRTGGIFFGRSFIDPTHKQYFRVSENGDAITLIPPSKLDHILKLPENIRSEIIKHVTQRGKTITFDLEKGTLETATTPENLRINITDFLRITSTIGNKKGNLTTSATRGQDVAPSNTSTSFEELRWPCPNIWLNGLGKVVEIESADTTMNPHAYIQKYTPWSTYRRTIFREYGVPLKGHTYWHDMDGYTPPAEAFDGSARFYIGWLQRCGFGVSPTYWSDAYFQIPGA
ncbi:uncharacterized protein J4E79_011083 [Alternaria viburni]|uniref:uncharacterized protein n=1 Tax=Alternaria viburni TaxID=566460 RepID=UPI0020C35780|nr:uncharacterized protein J4E79_011083 [Alternaria viburni]KAI4644646.1 hypothetical protein J4E79_011083 [Alternaria viburni]